MTLESIKSAVSLVEGASAELSDHRGSDLLMSKSEAGQIAPSSDNPVRLIKSGKVTVMNRRFFLQSLGAGAALNTPALAIGEHAPTAWLQKSLKIGMVKGGKSLNDKFAIARAAGFEGIELLGFDHPAEEVLAASASTGLVVDGLVAKLHHKVRHSDPDPAVRQDALAELVRCLEYTEAIGGHSVLLVPGHGKDGTPEQVFQRSLENIRQAIPTAARLGVSILIENVWNRFLYDHEGSSDQSAQNYADYIDAFNSPWVGMQFDIGNHWKYGDVPAWIRLLGTRIHKLDVKGFSRSDDAFTDIGEGDLPFDQVTRALRDINFHGWCAAEVKAKNADGLELVSQQMDAAFELKQK